MQNHEKGEESVQVYVPRVRPFNVLVPRNTQALIGYQPEKTNTKCFSRNKYVDERSILISDGCRSSIQEYVKLIRKKLSKPIAVKLFRAVRRPVRINGPEQGGPGA